MTSPGCGVLDWLSGERLTAMKVRLRRLLAGFRCLILDPSPRLRELRHEAEARLRPAPLPPLPGSAYPPGAVPLGTSGIPGDWLRCAECGGRMRRDPLCSDLALLTLHWMSEHREKYVAMHPETEPYLPS